MKKISYYDGWMYLFTPEDSTGAPGNDTLYRAANSPLGIIKTLLWVSIAMLVSMGISQLI